MIESEKVKIVLVYLYLLVFSKVYVWNCRIHWK